MGFDRICEGRRFFYGQHTDTDPHILTFLLELAVSLSKDDQLYKTEWVLRFISILCDAIFHQVRFEEFPDECAQLYFDLLNSLLDIDYAKLPQDQGAWFTEGYRETFNFIGRCDPLLRGNEAFLILWEKITSRCGAREINNYFDRWQETFEELK